MTRALKLAGLFGAGGTKYAILDAAPGRLKVSAPDAGAGEGESEIEAAFEGEPCVIGTNAPFLLELLATASAPVVTLAWQGATGGIVLREAHDAAAHEGDIWLVMPVHLAAMPVTPAAGARDGAASGAAGVAPVADVAEAA